MSLVTRCGNPDCGKLLRVKDELAGKRVKCPVCGQVTAVPAQVGASQIPTAVPIPHTTSTSKPVKVPPPPPSLSPMRTEPKGVGGWLLFFCLVLTVFSPLANLVALGMSYHEISQLFGKFPDLVPIAFVEACLTLGLMAFSVYAGTGLWTARPGAVQTCKIFLLCVVGVAVVEAVLIFMTIRVVVEYRTWVVPEFFMKTIKLVLGPMMRGILFASLWNLYLNKSKRVRNTYK